MHFYQKALLVAGLTAAIIAAGIAYERIYLSPQVERMQRQSEAAVSATETLPPECLQELTTVESPASALNSSSVGDPQNAATSESSTGIAGDTPPAGNDARHVATLIQVVDSSLAADPSVRFGRKGPVGGMGRAGGQFGCVAKIATPVADRSQAFEGPRRAGRNAEARRRTRPHAAAAGGRRPAASRGAARVAATRFQRGRSRTRAATLQSRYGSPQTACPGSAAVIERGRGAVADVAGLGPATGGPPGGAIDAGDDRRSGLADAGRSPGPQGPRPADPGAGQSHRQAGRDLADSRGTP